MIVASEKKTLAHGSFSPRFRCSPFLLQMDENTGTSSPPPGRSTRNASRITVSGSVKCSKALSATTRSKLASSSVKRLAFISRNSTGNTTSGPKRLATSLAKRCA